MNTNKSDFSPFDDDFEVLYFEDETEEDLKNNIQVVDETVKATKRPAKNSSNSSSKSPTKNNNRAAKARKKSTKKPVKKLTKTGSNIAKSSGKVVKSTVKGTMKVIQICAHIITLALIAGIIVLIAMKFASQYASHGSLSALISERNYNLAAYLSVAAALVLFELISFAWAMTSPRKSNKILSGRCDVGRGLFSFIIIGGLCILSATFSEMIPEAHDALIGLKGGLKLYGSMLTVLLPLCIAGVVCCLVRKFTSK